MPHRNCEHLSFPPSALICKTSGRCGSGCEEWTAALNKPVKACQADRVVPRHSRGSPSPLRAMMLRWMSGAPPPTR